MLLEEPVISNENPKGILYRDKINGSIIVTVPDWTGKAVGQIVLIYWGETTYNFRVGDVLSPVLIAFSPDSVKNGIYDVYYYIQDGAQKIESKVKTIILMDAEDSEEQPEKVNRLQSQPVVIYDNNRVGLDGDLTIINSEMIESVIPINVELSFNQQAGRVCQGDKVLVNAYISGYNPDFSKKKAYLKIPSLTVSDVDVSNGYCTFVLSKKELSDFDGSSKCIPGIMWMNAIFKNSSGDSYSCTWWCNVDTVSPGTTS
ncbi:hypothetical protein IAJ99_003769 [Salmonella enterica]|nr:hypothetical protein [Salmonella enterica]EGD6367829.1 hypothetical protein [Salmonella enterica]